MCKHDRTKLEVAALWCDTCDQNLVFWNDKATGHFVYKNATRLHNSGDTLGKEVSVCWAICTECEKNA